MAASNLVLLCKGSGLCAAACNRQEWQQSLCSTPRTAQLLIRQYVDTLVISLLLGWWMVDTLDNVWIVQWT